MQFNDEDIGCIRSVHILNRLSSAIKFAIEPWGEFYEMPAGAKFIVVAVGPDDGDLEVVFADALIAVYAWASSSIAVFHNGVKLGPAT